VPLAPKTIELLSSLPRVANDLDLVFPRRNGKGPLNGFSAAKARLDALLPPMAPWNVHDIRRSFASAYARLGTGMHVGERLLNHVSGSFAGIAGIYQRPAMEVWTAHINGSWRLGITSLHPCRQKAKSRITPARGWHPTSRERTLDIRAQLRNIVATVARIRDTESRAAYQQWLCGSRQIYKSCRGASTKAGRGNR
jgi:hypothetical protein